MVLINELTIDEIHAALVHLQRSRTEIVGGEKGDTINNILINNTGSGNNVDYSNIIDIIQNRLNAHDKTIENDEKRLEENENLDSTQQEQIESLFAQLEELSNNGIQSLQFDATNRYLIIYTQDGNTYDVEIPSETVTMSFDSATNKLIFQMGNQTQEVVLPFVSTSQMGVAGGVATLDENGRVPYSQLPESAMEFKGEWDASTNTPTLADGTGTNGDFYICSAGGTVNFGTVAEPRLVTFVVNDRVIYEGDTDLWVKLPAGQVASVNGQSGVVELDADDIPYDATMSVKDKLDSASQADWTETDPTEPSFIKHKIPIWITNGTPTVVSEIQQYFDIVHPINEIYIQYPQQKDPNTLYNNGSISSTWTLQTQYAGAFFRSSGGNADTFIEEGNALTKQGNQNAYHNHGGYTGNNDVGHTHNLNSANAKATSSTSANYSSLFRGSGDTSTGLGTGAKGHFSTVTYTTSTTLSGRTEGQSANHKHSISYDGSSTDTEARPDNFTIQIWKRTA